MIYHEIFSRNFSLPKNRPLVPLYEAVVNSINAIDERANKLGPFQGKIEIEVIRDQSLFADSDNHTVKGFCICDNGIGFDEANMNRSACFFTANSSIYRSPTMFVVIVPMGSEEYCIG